LNIIDYYWSFFIILNYNILLFLVAIFFYNYCIFICYIYYLILNSIRNLYSKIMWFYFNFLIMILYYMKSRLTNKNQEYLYNKEWLKYIYKSLWGLTLLLALIIPFKINVQGVPSLYNLCTRTYLMVDDPRLP